MKVLVKDQYGETLDTVPAGYTVNVNVDGTSAAVTGVTAGDETDLKKNLNDKEITFTA